MMDPMDSTEVKPLAPPHRLHVYSTKHNTHIVVSKPDGKPALSVSAGQLGLRKAGRGTFDAAFQVSVYVMKRIQEKGLIYQIQRLELVFRGFGQGRRAFTKTLMGVEGRVLRNKITSVADATRLKFGGTRSPKPRRLG